ncbi:TetR/AcrR family transcriptional regulator [Fuchsiella alkaliacetigena]|uniref:TetR/AcrR family transcriptional regulator n=1 Tax=Fuchsiella alkaliacetigena TaxID=957042 RepID=UPI00200AC067|nr:TetR/AcrR family transcriptional regulator [Fuchsiella alkaliacetigena]MCK8825385.1 TetR/AcrR family transcriptional regulator [Fuchsiella alkaliacetigena]
MDAKKKQIIEAAIDIFSKKGSAETTMQEVAEEAGVGKGTIYRHFDNKEGLVSALIKFGIDELTAEIIKNIKDIDDPVKKLEGLIDTKLEFYNQNHSFCKFLMRELWGYKDKFEENIREVRMNHTVLIEEIIAAGVETGDFKEVNIETAAVALIGMVNINVLHYFVFSDALPEQNLKEDLRELCFEGLLT